MAAVTVKALDDNDPDGYMRSLSGRDLLGDPHRYGVFVDGVQVGYVYKVQAAYSWWYAVGSDGQPVRDYSVKMWSPGGVDPGRASFRTRKAAVAAVVAAAPRNGDA